MNNVKKRKKNYQVRGRLKVAKVTSEGISPDPALVIQTSPVS